MTFSIHHYGAYVADHSLLASTPQRNRPAYERETPASFGPVRILVKDGVRLKDPEIIPVAAHQFGFNNPNKKQL